MGWITNRQIGVLFFMRKQKLNGKVRYVKLHFSLIYQFIGTARRETRSNARGILSRYCCVMVMCTRHKSRRVNHSWHLEQTPMTIMAAADWSSVGGTWTCEK